MWHLPAFNENAQQVCRSHQLPASDSVQAGALCHAASIKHREGGKVGVVKQT